MGFVRDLDQRFQSGVEGTEWKFKDHLSGEAGANKVLCVKGLDEI